MSFMEIALLVVGVIIFVISFLLPEGNEAKSEKDIAAEREEVHRLIEQEIDGMKYKVNEVTNDTVENAVDKAERSLEKVSNEKIMAVNEYAGTVIEEINKNHKEVMFLYGMIKDKQTDLTNAVRKADATVKEIESVSHTAQAASETLLRGMSVATVSQKGLTKEQKAVFDDIDIPSVPVINSFERKNVERDSLAADNNIPRGRKGTALTQSKIFADLVNYEENENDDIDNYGSKGAFYQDLEADEEDPTAGKESVNPDDAYSAETLDYTDNDILSEPKAKKNVAIDVLSGTTFKEGNFVNVEAPAGRAVTAADFAAMVNGTTNRVEAGVNSTAKSKMMTQAPANNNDMIIEMSKQGMSTVEIAKTLGLGVGEVKLVIDLFR